MHIPNSLGIVLQSDSVESLPLDQEWFVGLIALSVLTVLVIAIGVGYWVYRDASHRENNAALWAVMTGGTLFVMLPIGLAVVLAYVIFRGEKKPPGPGHRSAEDLS